MGTRLRWTLVIGAAACVMLLASSCGSGVYEAAEEGDVARLVELAEDTADYQMFTRVAAVQQLGELGTPEAVDALLLWFEEGSPPGLEDDVLSALGTTGDPRAIEPLLAELAACDRTTPAADLEPDAESKLRTIIQGLANLPDPRVAEALLAELDAGRAAAIGEAELAGALAGQGEAITPALEARLANSDEYVFVPAAFALGDIYGATGNNARIVELLASPETFRIYEGVITGTIIGTVDVEPQVMVDSLNTVGDVRMAQAMLNSGVEEYEAAAEAWASAHGYTVSTWITTP